MRLVGKLMRAPPIAPLTAPAGQAVGAVGAVTPVPHVPLPLRLFRRSVEDVRTTALPRTRLSLRALSFLALVLLPTALAADYYFAIAADQYAAEFRFTLSTADPVRLDTLSLLAGNSVQSPAALESQILVQYINSRAIVDAIERSLDLRQLFSSPRADWWSRLPQQAPIEELVRYWKRQVDPFYDPSNGTVTVKVRAFAPKDALRLAQAIGAACENLVNDLSLRARRDTLQQAEAELAQAQSRLVAALAEMRTFRDREGLIDPAKAAESNNLLATRLHDELITANAKLATLKTYMRDDAPTVKVLKARIRSLEAQRRSLAHQLTGADSDGHPALSSVLGSYEQLEGKRKFAENAYQLASRGVEEARANAERQHVFVADFIAPSLPEEALYPRRWPDVGVAALMAFAVWGIGGLVVQSVRDHLW